MKKKIALMSCYFVSCFFVKADRAYLSLYAEDMIDHRPLKGLGVIANFADDIGWRAWTESPKPDIAKGFTDQHGICRLSGKTNCGRGSIWINKTIDGYYRPFTGGGVEYTGKSIFGVWQPENVVITVGLQRVEHPIPLYVRKVELASQENGIAGFDGTNIVLKFDFDAGDWLPPHGCGKYVDMIIRTKYKVNECVDTGRGHFLSFYDFMNDIEFVGEGNGLMEVPFPDMNYGIKIRIAPKTGYVGRRVLKFGQRRKTEIQGVWPNGYTESDKNRCYCFRIRSKFDEKGHLIAANYGKIYGDFNFMGWEKRGLVKVEFLYYLNPTLLDRNLEWDMKTNLAPNPDDYYFSQP